MSRRKQRAREAGAAGAGGDAAKRAAGGPAHDLAGRPAARSQWGLAVQIGFAVAAFAVAVLVAELAGAANLGVSFGVGQIALAIAVSYLLVRR